jgi:1-pyrroline-5-carboxylate dehydrogenase
MHQIHLKKVQAAYTKMWNSKIDVPLYIGSEEIRTGNTRTMYHDHKHIVGTYHLAEKRIENHCKCIRV